MIIVVVGQKTYVPFTIKDLILTLFYLHSNSNDSDNANLSFLFEKTDFQNYRFVYLIFGAKKKKLDLIKLLIIYLTYDIGDK